MANPQVDPRKIRSLIRASGCEDGPWSVEGLKNVEMIPLVRTLEMAKDVNEVLASRRTSWFQGLKDGQMPRGSQETTILQIWWLILDQLINY